MSLALVLSGACGGPQQSRASRPPEPDPPPLPWSHRRSAAVPIESPLTALVGGTLMTAAGDVIEDGVLVMQDGRLRAVGVRGEIAIPDGARTVDVTGRYVTPGLIDTHSHMGVYPSPHVQATADGNEVSDPTTPEVRAADAFWPQDPQLPRAVAGGVTTIQVLPGSGNLIGGAGVILKLRLRRTVAEMEFPGAPETLKMACGENPKRVYGRGRQSFPMTRMGNVFGYRNAFREAIEYERAFRDWQANHVLWQRDQEDYREALEDGDEEAESPGPAPAPPARDYGLERLLGARDGAVLIQMHCYRAEEMARMVQIGDEFGFRVRAFHHAIEAYKVRDLLADREIGVSTWADSWGFKLEAYDMIEENLALLTESGVRAVLHSDSAMLVQRLNQEAAKALAAGRRAGIELTDDQALRWVTLDAAWTLGVDQHTGSLEEGKMADVVVWSGHPFSVYSRADQVFIDGLEVYDRRAGPDPVHRTDFELGQDLELRRGGE